MASYGICRLYFMDKVSDPHSLPKETAALIHNENTQYWVKLRFFYDLPEHKDR